MYLCMYVHVLQSININININILIIVLILFQIKMYWQRLKRLYMM